jgi:hypothetical protein
MKLHEQLFINGSVVTLSSKLIHLEWQAVGSASVTFVTNEKPVMGMQVVYQLAHGSGEFKPMFQGYISQVIELKNNQYQAKCKEWTSLLHKAVSLNLRHVTAKEIITKLGELTGVSFILPKADWINEMVPRFQHVGTAQTAIKQLFKAFNIVNPCWLLQPNLAVYVGESNLSLSGSKTVTLPVEQLQAVTFQGATITLVPRLKVGTNVVFNDSVYVVNTIDIQGLTMRLGWFKQIELTGAA